MTRLEKYNALFPDSPPSSDPRPLTPYEKRNAFFREYHQIETPTDVQRMESLKVYWETRYAAAKARICEFLTDEVVPTQYRERLAIGLLYENDPYSEVMANAEAYPDMPAIILAAYVTHHTPNMDEA